MVKGVNKTIIEINNTGSKYFDRVLLFVNPTYTGVPKPLLECRADELIRKAGVPDFSLRHKRRGRKAVLFIGIAAIIAAAVAAFILII